jgi:biotin transport system substrate-specific component
MNKSNRSQAYVAKWVHARGEKLTLQLMSVLSGAVLLTLLAQLYIRLPFTPIPITGQTFGVALISLLWGRKLGLATVMLYLTMGGLGLPVFALARAGLSGPTLGYLIGMLVASIVVGSLADRGWTRSYFKALAAAFIGSGIIYAFGVLFLAQFVGYRHVIPMGVLPFLPGDFLKNLLAALIAHKLGNRSWN